VRNVFERGGEIRGHVGACVGNERAKEKKETHRAEEAERARRRNLAAVRAGSF
jgi:hypothetical protein